MQNMSLLSQYCGRFSWCLILQNTAVRFSLKLLLGSCTDQPVLCGAIDLLSARYSSSFHCTDRRQATLTRFCFNSLLTSLILLTLLTFPLFHFNKPTTSLVCYPAHLFTNTSVYLSICLLCWCDAHWAMRRSMSSNLNSNSLKDVKQTGQEMVQCKRLSKTPLLSSELSVWLCVTRYPSASTSWSMENCPVFTPSRKMKIKFRWENRIVICFLLNEQCEEVLENRWSIFHQWNPFRRMTWTP